jgi:hypothetical protein
MVENDLEIRKILEDLHFRSEFTGVSHHDYHLNDGFIALDSNQYKEESIKNPIFNKFNYGKSNYIEISKYFFLIK